MQVRICTKRPENQKLSSDVPVLFGKTTATALEIRRLYPLGRHGDMSVLERLHTHARAEDRNDEPRTSGVVDRRKFCFSRGSPALVRLRPHTLYARRLTKYRSSPKAGQPRTSGPLSLDGQRGEPSQLGADAAPPAPTSRMRWRVSLAMLDPSPFRDGLPVRPPNLTTRPGRIS